MGKLEIISSALVGLTLALPVGWFCKEQYSSSSYIPSNRVSINSESLNRINRESYFVGIFFGLLAETLTAPLAYKLLFEKQMEKEADERMRKAMEEYARTHPQIEPYKNIYNLPEIPIIPSGPSDLEKISSDGPSSVCFSSSNPSNDSSSSDTSSDDNKEYQGGQDYFPESGFGDSLSHLH